MAVFCRSVREAIPRARPVRLTPTTEIPNYWESSIGVWEFQEDQRAPRGSQLSTGYPHLTVDNSAGVWEF